MSSNPGKVALPAGWEDLLSGANASYCKVFS